MRKALNTSEPIVTNSLQSAAQEIIELVRQNTPYPFLLDGKFGDANIVPMSDTKIASAYDKPLSTISDNISTILSALDQADQQNDSPLGQIAQRANDVMAQAGIINRHNRRPPLYVESTISAFIELGYAVPEHSPLIRAAGYIFPPPITPLSHDITFIIADIAAHMASSHEPQRPDQVIQSLHHRQDTLTKWPQLDLTLFIHRVAGIRPDDRGYYHPDQPWNSFISAKRLVTSTMLRIFARDQQPRKTAYLTSETERLVGHLLPSRYNTLSAIRMAAAASDQVSWQGPSTFGLKKWETALDPRNMARPRGRTGDLIYVYLMQNGPADIEDVIEHFEQTANIKKRTVQESLNHDPADRFIRISDQRVAANPIPQGHNPNAPALVVVPDAHNHQPPPVLHESELLWITRYVQVLNDLEPPLPAQVTVTGPRATGFAQDDPLEITVIVDPSDRPSLEPRLAKIAAATSDSVPSVQPQISILSPQQWDHQQSSEAPQAHHNAWLAPNTKQLPNSPDDKI